MKIEKALQEELGANAMLMDYVVMAIGITTDGDVQTMTLVRPGSYPHVNVGLACMLMDEVREVAER
jgi:hypothetical protein